MMLTLRYACRGCGAAQHFSLYAHPPPAQGTPLAPQQDNYAAPQDALARCCLCLPPVLPSLGKAFVAHGCRCVLRSRNDGGREYEGISAYERDGARSTAEDQPMYSDEVLPILGGSVAKRLLWAGLAAGVLNCYLGQGITCSAVMGCVGHASPSPPPFCCLCCFFLLHTIPSWWATRGFVGAWPLGLASAATP